MTGLGLRYLTDLLIMLLSPRAVNQSCITICPALLSDPSEVLQQRQKPPSLRHIEWTTDGGSSPNPKLFEGNQKYPTQHPFAKTNCGQIACGRARTGEMIFKAK